MVSFLANGLKKIIEYEKVYQKDLRDLNRVPTNQDYQRLFKSLLELINDNEVRKKRNTKSKQTI
jgi:hypothetical protein